MDMANVDALPEYPLGLDKRIIPRDELVLLADIYTEGVLIIDDGYDRAKLNVHGGLAYQVCRHMEPGTALPGIARPLQRLWTLASGATGRLQSANFSGVATKAAEQSAARCYER